MFETRDHNLENDPEAADERFNYRRCSCHAIFLADPPEDLARHQAAGDRTLPTPRWST